jgi:hypothetical protein
MISRYVIYGERHSGTKFLEKLITKNFNLSKSELFGHKHFFRPKYILDKESEILDSTIFFCIVRNPYDWIMAFHKLRHHCAIIGANDIYRFISKEWISRNDFFGIEILEDRHLYADRRYINIFEMRRAKLEYMFYILPLFIKNYIFIKYEDFFCETFAVNFLNKLIDKFKLSRYYSVFDIDKFHKKNYYDLIDDNLLKFINNSLDWKIENQIGYIKANSITELQQQS